MAGGVVRLAAYGATGRFAVSMLRELRVDQVFLAIHSLSARAGLTYPRVRGGRRQASAHRSRIESGAAGGPLEVRSRSAGPGRADHSGQHDRHHERVDSDELAAIRELGVEVIMAPNASASPA